MKTGNKTTLNKYPFFVIFIGIIAPLILYANNLGEVTLASLWKLVILSGLLGLAIFGVAYLIFKNVHKAALVTGIVELLIFFYGHIYNLVKPLSLLGHSIGRHRYLFPVLGIVFAILIWQAIRSKANLDNITLLLNVVTGVLLVFQVVQIATYEIKLYRNQQQTTESGTPAQSITFDGEKRDIYVILLDEYMRSDWLLEAYGYDNSEFIQKLEELGFYVPPCSMSNYAYTQLSMISEFNMNYLDNYFDPLSEIATSDLLKHNEVRRIVEDLGYKTVFFQNFYPWVDIADGDYYFKPEDVSSFDPFVNLFLETTLLRLPADLLERQIAETRWSAENESITRHAELIQSIFEYLQQPHDYDAPVYVYAHILSPHNPRPFNPDGTINYQWKDDSSTAVLNTYQYLDNETIKTIEAILANSETEPIIIVQSDHGDGDGGYKNLTLNAFYFPDGGEEALYPTITPVNIFRIVFNTYFDMDFDLLEDKSYYSEKLNRYNLEEVQDPYNYCQDLHQ